MDTNAIFGYPLDNELILRKQKSIRRELLSRTGINYVDKRIAILGGSTTSNIKNILELFLLQAGIKPQFYESEYNKYYEDALFGTPLLDEFEPEIIIIFTSAVNILEKPSIRDDLVSVQAKLDSEFNRFKQMWENLSEKYNAAIIQNNMELPYIRSLGNLETVLPFGMSRFIERLNIRFADYAASHGNFYIHDLHELSARIGLRRWHNRAQYHSYKFAMDYDVVPDVSSGLAKIIKAILGKTKKCLVLDLDNTLWGGVIGDDGLNGIKIGHETPEAEFYMEFQRYVLGLKERGIILAVCSKNDEDIAKSGFTHPDSVLKVDDFAAFHANWEPKDQNIRAIAAELNIGTDSLVFIDDNPVERQIVRENLPEVSVPEVDATDPFSYIRSIEEAGYFEFVALSEEDFKRSESYVSNRKRTELAHSVSDYDDFLKALDMRAEIGSFREVYFDRIAQLTNKTNQFNLTTRRCTRAEIEAMANAPKYITLYGRLEDKFGDNGLVTVVIGERRGDELHIILWLMSCRVLKRGLERAMLDALINEAEGVGLKKIVGYYFKTPKNKMVSMLYEEFGFKRISQTADDTVWELDTNDYVAEKNFIEVNMGD